MAQTSAVKLTYADYVLIPDDGKRHEIIDGEHYVSPSPKIIHQRVLLNLATILKTFVEDHEIGEVFVAPTDVVLSNHNVFQPDILFINTVHMHVITEANVWGTPDLAVEILSDGTRRIDEKLKFAQYEKFGVSEYWIVDCVKKTIRLYRRNGEKLELVDTVPQTGVLQSSLFPGLELEMRRVFRD